LPLSVQLPPIIQFRLDHLEVAVNRKTAPGEPTFLILIGVWYDLANRLIGGSEGIRLRSQGPDTMWAIAEVLRWLI
jgi:hypothetical protein